MYPGKNQSVSLALFCKVVDNYGDVGICWRLSQQLRHQHGIDVTLWIDDLSSLQRICPRAMVNVFEQQLLGVVVRHWRSAPTSDELGAVADIVIEFFGCEVPESYVAAMAQCEPRPVWLNLEGLSAEKWVEGCHMLPSPHPRFPLTKYFFFPGFNNQTGGLLHELALHEQRRHFQSSAVASATFFERLGVTADEVNALKVSLFCYPHAPVTAMFDSWERGDVAVTCLVPDGVAVAAVQAFLGAQATPGTVRTRGALTVRVVRFMAQPDYDRLLWACDLNFVRGEDSFVRAQWAGKPFLWHIYPQDNNLHHVKLRAFLECYAGELGALVAASIYWNGMMDEGVDDIPVWDALWPPFQAAMPRMIERASQWTLQMQANGDLSTNLLNFAEALRSDTAQNKL